MSITIRLIIILIIFFTVSIYFISKKKYTELLCIAAFILLFFPVDALGIISGSNYNSPGRLNISLIGYFTLISFFTYLIINKGKITCNKIYLLGVFGSLGVIFGIRIVFDGSDFLSNKLFDNYFLPSLLGLMVVSEKKKIDFYKLFDFIYGCIIINSIVAILEYFVCKSLFFHQYYLSNIPWYANVYDSTFYGIAFRSTALLGHPLTGGIYYSVALVYGLNKYSQKRNIKSLLSIFLLVGAIITTNARSVMLFMIIYILYFLATNKKYKEIFLMILISCIILFCTDINALYTKWFARDLFGSSYMVRVNSLLKFSKIPFYSLLIGTGYNNAGGLLSSLGFTTNFEIAYFIILIENGLIGFITWVIYLILGYDYKNMKLNNRRKKLINNMIFAFLFISVFFNSFGDPGSLNYFLWLLLGSTHLIVKSREVSYEHYMAYKKNDTKYSV